LASRVFKHNSAVAGWLAVGWCVLVGGCWFDGAAPGGWQGELVEAEVVTPTMRWRGRLVSAGTLSGDIVTRLNEAFDLVVLREAGQWSRLWAAVGEPAAPAAPDFSMGVVVGLVARVGQPVDGSWPVEVVAIRLLRGAGGVDGRISPGLYYPLAGPAFVELAYVPGLVRVRLVRLGQEQFELR
jgi:hypothetical protein